MQYQVIDFNGKSLCKVVMPTRVDCVSLAPVFILASRDEVLASYTWMFEELAPGEEIKLDASVDSMRAKIEDDHYRQHCYPGHWFLIHWQ